MCELVPRELAIEYRSIDSIIPYANNPRVRSRAQIQKLKRSLKKRWTNPLLVDNLGNLVCGHGAAVQRLSSPSRKQPLIQERYPLGISAGSRILAIQ